MKYTIYIATLLLISFPSLSFSGAKNPEKLIKLVQKILKNLPETSIKKYTENFISLEKIHEIGKSDVLVRNLKQRKELQLWSEDEYQIFFEEKIIEPYKEMIDEEKNGNIVWANIEFQDTAYKVEFSHYVKSCNGTINFKSKGRLYSVKFNSFFDGKKYRLIGIGDTRELP